MVPFAVAALRRFVSGFDAGCAQVRPCTFEAHWFGLAERAGVAKTLTGVAHAEEALVSSELLGRHHAAQEASEVLWRFTSLPRGACGDHEEVTWTTAAVRVLFSVEEVIDFKY